MPQLYSHLALSHILFFQALEKTGISFEDNSDPDFEYKDLQRDILELSAKNHWKTATRRLKKLTKNYGISSDSPREIPEELFTSVLEACMVDRLHFARAAEPTRRVMECMLEYGYDIPTDAANYCIKACLGKGPDGTFEESGGIDSALAMLAAVSKSSAIVNPDTYAAIISSMAHQGADGIDDALSFLRELVVDKSETPTLQLFANVAMTCANTSGQAEKVMTVLAYVKAAGYELDAVASTADGRTLLAAGVIAAEQLDNTSLGLRLLTAASNAPGCDPDRGDALVASSSSAAQRAATILHRRAINKACQQDEESWKLAVKLLELMMERNLTPSPSVWRNVVTCCCKVEKSRKATALLLDWVRLLTIFASLTAYER